MHKYGKHFYSILLVKFCPSGIIINFIEIDGYFLCSHNMAELQVLDKTVIIFHPVKRIDIYALIITEILHE